MFTVSQNDSSGTQARTGTLETSRSKISTPMLMPVATQAAFKSLDTSELEKIGYRLILANNYHLYLRPGHKRVEQLGGDVDLSGRQHHGRFRFRPHG